MRKLFFLFVLLLYNIVLQAQSHDYILKKNGDELYGTIKEITPQEVKYSDTLTPQVTRVVIKSEIFMIRFRNGVKEVYGEPEQNQTVSKVPSTSPAFEGPIIDLGSNDFSVNGKIYHFKQVKNLLLSLDDPRIDQLLAQARLDGLIGNIVAYSSIPMGYLGFVLVGSGNSKYGYSTSQINAGITLSVLCLASNVTNIILKVKKKQKIQQAIDIYNKKVEEMAAHQP